MAELSTGNYGGRGDGTYSPAGPRGHSRGFDLLQQMDIDSDDDNRDLKEMAAPSLVEREAREREYKEIEEFVLGSGISKTSSPEPTPREAARRELEKEEQARLEQAKRDEDERLYLADQEERNRYAINVAKDIINREDRGSPTFSENDDMSPRATTTATTNT